MSEASDEAGGSAGRGIGVGASAAVLFLLLRLLAVSNWDWRTASAIMAVTDVESALTMLFGTLMADAPLTGVLVALILPITVLHLVWPLRRDHRSLPDTLLSTAVLVAAALALCATFRYFWVPVAAVAVGVAIVAARLFWRHGRGRSVVEFVFRRTWVLGGLALLAIAAVSTTPWVPEEAVVTDTGTVHGYVLKAEPGFLTVLTEPDRTVRVLTTSTVLRRD